MQREIEKGRDGEGGREGRETERVSVWPYMVQQNRYNTTVSTRAEDFSRYYSLVSTAMV